MTRAERKGSTLRRKLGLTGRVDAEAVANLHGYPVMRLPLVKHKEPEVAGYVCIADRLGPEESRWYIAHALGRKMMHPGNHLWIYKKTMLGYRYDGKLTTSPTPCSPTTGRRSGRAWPTPWRWRGLFGGAGRVRPGPGADGIRLEDKVTDNR